jgi:hypothetical protein
VPIAIVHIGNAAEYPTPERRVADKFDALVVQIREEPFFRLTLDQRILVLNERYPVHRFAELGFQSGTDLDRISTSIFTL